MRTQLLALLSLITLPSLSHASTADQFVIPNPNAKMAHQPEIQIQTHTQPSLADLLTIEPTASIFYSYARELEISSQFSETKQTKWTILVPTNKAVMALSRKPHEDPAPSDPVIEMSDQEFQSVSKQNVERWISAHIIPQSPITLTSRTYKTLLCGKSVTFSSIDGSDASTPEWTRVFFEDNVRIIGMKEASNGVLYLVDGTVKVD